MITLGMDPLRPAAAGLPRRARIEDAQRRSITTVACFPDSDAEGIERLPGGKSAPALTRLPMSIRG